VSPVWNRFHVEFDHRYGHFDDVARFGPPGRWNLVDFVHGHAQRASAGG